MKILERNSDGSLTLPPDVFMHLEGKCANHMVVEAHGTSFVCTPLSGTELSKGMAKELRGVEREKIVKEAEDVGRGQD